MSIPNGEIIEWQKKSTSTKAIVRDSNGKFVNGNKESRKFQKGYASKPKGAKNKKTLAPR